MGSAHARILNTMVAGATVSSVFDIDHDRARSAVSDLGTARVMNDPLELIQDADVDVVLVASSDQSHEQFVLAAIAANKPVLCEKPLAPTSVGCLRVLDAERAAGTRLVSVGFMRRYDPGYLDLKSALAADEIGAPLMLHCVHRNPSAVPDVASSTLITGSAVHEIDISRWLLGEEFVAATVHTPRRSRNAGGFTQDPQFLVLETANGVLVDIEVFVNARYGYEVRCELVGENGTVSLDSPAPTVLRSGGVASRGLPRDWRPRFAEAYRAELQGWVNSIKTGLGGSGATAWDGYVATTVAEACVAALESGTRQIIQPEANLSWTSSAGVS
jgi:myo-inositol 2-dehydrogenase/D-chiro-inositol 1-dehydrogenase